ncbi:MAG TPA: hypothetical protein VF600_05105 [Abditibacteriaceae bacterium]
MRGLFAKCAFKLLIGALLLGYGTGVAWAGSWQVTYICNGSSSGSIGSSTWPSTTTPPSGTTISFNTPSSYGNNLINTGTITAKLTWKPSNAVDRLPDALWVRESATSVARGYQATTTQVYTPYPHPVTTRSQPTLSAGNGLGDSAVTQQITDSGGQPVWSTQSSSSSTNPTLFYPVSLANGSVNSNGEFTVTLGTRTLDAKASYNASSGTYGSPGSVETTVYYRVDPASIWATAPSPFGDPAMGENEYTVVGGGQPFIVSPCIITVAGAGAQDLETLRQKASWTAPTFPYPLSWTAAISNGNIVPQFQSDMPSDPNPTREGLGYSTLNGLPATNNVFGPNTVTHKLNGSTLGVAAIEVFYASTAFTHNPNAGIHYCLPHLSTENYTSMTPNWFYYYYRSSGSLPCTVAYGGSGGSYYYPGQDHVHIGDNAHGKNLSRVEVFKPQSGSPYLQWVGYIPSVGIDAFARVVAHEFRHKQIWETYHASIEAAEQDNEEDILLDANGNAIPASDGYPIAIDPDADPDHDGLPTWYENQIGLHPTRADSTGFAAHSSSLYDPGYASGFGDGEVVARMAEEGVTGSRPNDWADDGLNHDTNPGTNDAMRTTIRYRTSPWQSWNN